MSSIAPLGLAEVDLLARALRELSHDWGIENRSVDQLAEEWAGFVSDVSTGYELTLHDYTRELEFRDAVAEMKDELPRRLAEEIEAAFKPSDERFRFATEVSRVPLMPGVGAGASWWWYSRPRQASAEFWRELRELE